jgi:hypothetical protein
MRRYDDPVDVRRGRVAGPGSGPGSGAGGGQALVEGPEQFLWQGRLWKVHAVLAQWVETGPWWSSSGAHAVLGAEDWNNDGDPARLGERAAVSTLTADPTIDLTAELAAEREVWRVEASRGLRTDRGVFDLVFDWADGGWRLTRCLD